MKGLFFIFIMSIGFPLVLLSQEDTLKRSQIYLTWITLINNPQKVTGVLHEIKDSSILVSRYSGGVDQILEVGYKNIDIVQARKRNNSLQGAFIGTVIGIVLGAGIGVGSDNNSSSSSEFTIDFSPGLKAFGGATLGAFCGAGVGAILGTVRLNIPVNGNLEKFNSSKSRLKNYSYIH